jgi:hypothetical protein
MEGASGDSAALDTALAAAFSQLSQLTELQLAGSSTSSLAAASCLTQLQKLDLTGPGGHGSPLQLQLLPSSVTEVQLERVFTSERCSESWQLPSLRILAAYESLIYPAALLRMPQLQQLRLDGYRKISMEDLLNALSQLQHMVYMVFQNFTGVAPAPCYAALTASLSLKGFELTDCRMAAAAAQHMFPPGRSRPQLQRLRFAGTACGRWADDEAYGYLGLVLSQRDAAKLVSCCPQLQDLGPVMVRRGTSYEDLQPLVQLSVMTRLQIGGVACDDAVAECVLAHLTGEI